MGKQETVGFILIAAVVILWIWFSTPKHHPIQDRNVTPQEFVGDTAKKIDSSKQLPETIEQPLNLTVDNLGKFFSGTDVGKEHVFTVETDNYIAELSTRGGLIKQWTLKQYKTWDNHHVQLVDGGGEIAGADHREQ